MKYRSRRELAWVKSSRFSALIMRRNAARLRPTCSMSSSEIFDLRATRGKACRQIHILSHKKPPAIRAIHCQTRHPRLLVPRGVEMPHFRSRRHVTQDAQGVETPMTKRSARRLPRRLRDPRQIDARFRARTARCESLHAPLFLAEFDPARSCFPDWKKTVRSGYLPITRPPIGALVGSDI